jgi:putative PIN family toxin of toxin-antitoxin system
LLFVPLLDKKADQVDKRAVWTPLHIDKNARFADPSFHVPSLHSSQFIVHAGALNCPPSLRRNFGTTTLRMRSNSSLNMKSCERHLRTVLQQMAERLELRCQILAPNPSQSPNPSQPNPSQLDKVMSYAISLCLRFVLDTDVLVAALRSRGGASWQLVDRALKRDFTLLLSVPLILEHEAVLTREEHRKVHALRVPEVDEVINSLASVAESVQIRFLWRPFLSDPTDDMVLETAVNGRADLLVTFNQEDFAAAAKSFAVKIVRPSEALHRLRALTSE